MNRLLKVVNRSLFAWLISWLVLYASSIVLYNYSYEFTRGVLIHTLQVKPAAWLVKLTLPGMEIWHSGASIFAPGNELMVMRGCDGIEAWLLMVTALIVFPMPWRRRIRSVGYGTILIFTLNLIRIVSLFHIMLLRPEWMEMAHGLIWQSVMVMSAVLFVLVWLQPDAKSEKRRA